MRSAAPGILAAILFILAVQLCSAHGLENEQNRIAGDFLFELGSEPAQPVEGEQVTFSLAVHNATTEVPLPQGSVWIRISSGNSVVFASSFMHTTNESPLFFNYEFPRSGDYQVDAAVLGDSGEIERVSFPVKVSENPQNREKILLAGLIGLLIGIVAGAILAVAFTRPRKRKGEVAQDAQGEVEREGHSGNQQV